MTSRQVFEAPEILRPITNVNGFVPARSLFPVVRYELGPGLTITAADLYVIGSDGADDILALLEPCPPASIILSAEDSKEVEKWLRAQKRARVELRIVADIEGRLWLQAENLEAMEPELGAWRETVHDIDPDKWPNWFAQIDSLMEPLERRTEEELRLPDAIAFGTARLAAFAKVRTADTSADVTVMDLRIYDPNEPVHVKIGPSFRGAIQPITREAALEGALWNE